MNKSGCNLCPRRCNVSRSDNDIGYCKVESGDDKIMVSRAALHMWEEPCISGEAGSGAVFFSGCSLRCVFCQNHEIAMGNIGKYISVMRLSEIFLELQEKQANNINLVTPTHYIPQIIKAITAARENGLSIPIVYNTSGYENVESLRLLDGYVDIYLPDFKYIDNDIAFKYSNARNYFDVASRALEEMYRQVGEFVFDEKGILKKGMIVRHMILPGCTTDSKAIIKYLYDTYGNSIFISIMNQYTPLSHVVAYPELNRKITDKEYDEVVDYAIDIGVENGFIQEGETASESFIPNFDCEGI